MASLSKEAILAELKRRREASGTGGSRLVNGMMAMLSELQRSFIMDESRFKIARCGRRGGKTVMGAVYLIKTALENKGVSTLYLGLTRESAKEIVWDVLKNMLNTANIRYHAAESRLKLSFENGSSIRLFGADTPDAKKRLRGPNFKLIIVDECGFVKEVDELVYTVLPSLADTNGTLCLTSSPGEYLTGLFYEADVGTQKDTWSSYHWDMRDNPLFQKPALNPKYENRAEEEMATVISMQFGGDWNHPAFQREYLGKWVADQTSLVYPAEVTRNIVESGGEYPEIWYGMGIDLGSVAANAIVIARYTPYSKEVCFVEAWKQGGLSIDALAGEIATFNEKYKPHVIVADTGGYGKGIVEELRHRYQLPIQAADKTDKAFHQRIMANDLLSGYVKVLKGLSLVEEWAKIVKDENGEELPNQVNHAADAALYIYRKIYQVHLKAYEVPKTEEQTMMEQLEDQVRQEEAFKRDLEDYG